MCYCLTGQFELRKKKGNFVLPVIRTFEAPMALATSKQTNPIGPVKKDGENKCHVTWSHAFKKASGEQKESMSQLTDCEVITGMVHKNRGLTDH